MAVSEAKIRANARYTKKAYKKVAIYLNKDSNKEIIECLDGVKSKNAFIIECINEKLESMKSKAWIMLKYLKHSKLEVF